MGGDDTKKSIVPICLSNVPNDHTEIQFRIGYSTASLLILRYRNLCTQGSKGVNSILHFGRYDRHSGLFGLFLTPASFCLACLYKREDAAMLLTYFGALLMVGLNVHSFNSRSIFSSNAFFRFASSRCRLRSRF
jgi:hypothetical protein